MVNLYQKALAIAALITFQGLQAQVGISNNMEFRPDPNIALHVDGKLNVRGVFKSTNEPTELIYIPENIPQTEKDKIKYGQAGQVLQMKSVDGQLQPQWVNPPVSLLEEGMYYIENTYTTTSTSGATFSSSDTNSYVNANIDNELFSNGWKKIAEFSENNISKNFKITQSKNNINILIESGVQLTSSTSTSISSSNNAQYVCGLFSKANNANDNTSKLRAYRIGQINGITNQSNQHSNFNLLYTIKDFPIGEYNFFVACKKMSQSGTNTVLRIGNSNINTISQFTERPLVKLDILYQL